jgi:mannosyltransferase
MSRDLLFRLFLLPILLLAFGLRVYHLDLQSIWWDEGHSIEMASASLSAIATLPGMDVHPPGYFMVLHLWMGLVGMTEFALRYLSVVFSVLVVALLVRFARERVCGMLLCGALAALLPLYVAYAQEVRMYAMLTCLVVLSGYAQWRILFRGATRRWWAVYALAAAAALYTHYFAIFLLVFQNGAWLVWASARREGRARRFACWIGSQLAILVLFAPQLPLALRQTTAYANPNLRPPPVGEFFSRTWLAHTVGSSVYPTLQWMTTAAALVTLATLVLWAWRSARERSAGRSAGTLLYLAGWFCIPLALYFVVVQGRPSFEPRYMIVVTPALLLLWAGAMGAPDYKSGASGREIGVNGREAGASGAGTGAMGAPDYKSGGSGREIGASGREAGPASRWPHAIGLVLAVALLAVLAAGTTGYFTNSAAFKDDAAGVARWLAAETTPEDLVYVDVPHPFHYYADRIPAPTRYLFVDVHTAADILNLEAAGRRRVYWVTWYGSDTDPRGVMPYLLDKAARRGGDRDFHGYHVTWWEMPAGVQFSLPEDLTPADLTFGSSIHVDAAAYGNTCRAGSSMWVTLHFALLGRTGVDYRASLRLRDVQGTMLPPTDKDILNDRHLRTAAWPADDARLNQAINVYALPVPSGSAPGDYRLELVVYDAATSTALPVAGVSSPDGISAPLGTVKVQR